MKSKKSSIFLHLSSTVFALTLSAHAASNTWTAAIDANWDSATANWTSPATWTSGDDAVFNAAGVGTINIATGGVSAHNLDFNTAAYTIQGAALTLNGSTPSITTATGVSTSIASIVTGSAGLTKAGAGTLILTGANNLTGGTTISGGTLQVGNGGTTGSLGSGNIVNNGTLAYNFSNISSIPLPSGAAISGTGNLSATARDIKLNGNITLGGSQSFTQIGGGGLYQGIEVAANTTLTASSITLSGDVGTQNATSRILTLDTSAVNGTINLNVSTARTNIWYGNVFNVNAGTGTINVTGTGMANSGWNSLVTLNGAINIPNNLSNLGNGVLNGPITITGNIANIGSAVFHATANSTISGNLGVNNGLNGYSPFNVDSGATLTISGALSGVSSLSWGGFQKQGLGTLKLMAANTGIGQGAQIKGGTINFVHNGLNAPSTSNGSRGYAIDFQGNAAIQWAAGNTDDLTAGNNMKIGDGFTATLDTGANNVTFGTAIVLGTLKTGALTKAGSGTLTMNAANTYTGATAINNGALLLNGGSLSASGTVSVAASTTFGGKGSAGAVSVAGGTLQGGLVSGNGSLSLASLDFNGSSALNLMPVNISSCIAVSGALNTSGTQTINLTNSSPLPSGAYGLLSYGSVGGSGIGAFVLGSTPGQSPGSRSRSYTLDTATSPGFVDLVVLGDAPIWTGNNSGAWNTTTNNWVLESDGNTPTTYFTADFAKFGNATGNRTVTISGTDVTPAGVAFNSDIDNDYTLGGSNGIAGTASLSKSGDSTLTITNTNSYTGGTTVNGGTLQLGNGATNGVIAGNIANTASLIFNNASAQTFGGVISGSNGTLTKLGAGTLTLGGTSTYTGATIINNGTVMITGAISSSSPVAVNSGVLSLKGNNATGSGGAAGTYTINGGTISNDGAANITQVINGLLTLNGGTLAATSAFNTTYGNFHLNGSGYQVTVTGTTASTISAVISLAKNHTFNVADTTAGVDLLVSGRVIGNSGLFSGAIIKTGAGTLKLSNPLNNSDSGGTMALTGVQLNAGQVIFVDGGLGNGRSYGGGAIAMKALFTGNATLTWDNGNSEDISAILPPPSGATTGGMKIEDAVTATLDTGANNVTLGTAIAVGTLKTGALTKTGSGTLTLGAANTYTGITTVNAGTLAVLGTSISDGNRLVIDGGKVDSTGTETVDKLYFGATQQAAGTWGAAGSGADHIDNTRFSGTGKVNVATGPPTNSYTSWIDSFTFALGADKTPNGDPDNDGLSNGIEYALGLNPTQSSGAPGTLNAGVLSFTKGAAAIANGDVTYIIEESQDLGRTDPWSAAVTQTPPNTSATIDYTLPAGTPKEFARLKVTIQ